MAAVEVILLKNIDSLGEMGRIVRVKPGFARNFLIPRELAAFATKRLVKQFEHSKRVVEAKVSKTRAIAEGLAKKINNTKVQFERKVGEHGKLFGSVTSGDIVEALAAKSVVVDKKQMILPTPIKAAGKVKVPVRLFRDVQAEVLVEIKGITAEEEA